MRLLLSMLVIATSCKPAVREPVADLHAITDGKLMLGTVAAVTKRRNLHVYRLLVCKVNIATEDTRVFGDDGQCRPALVDQHGVEVIFYPNKLRQGFAAKYKGRLKKATIGLLVSLPFLIAIPIAQTAVKPVYRYVRTITKKGDLGQWQKLADSDPGLASKGNAFYRHLHDRQAPALDKLASSIRGQDLAYEEIRGLASIIRFNSNTYDMLSQTSLISKLEDQHKMLLDMKSTGQNFRGVALSGEENKFINNFELTKWHEWENPQLPLNNFLTGKGRDLTPVEIQNMLGQVTTAERNLLKDMPRYHELVVKDIISQSNNLDEAMTAIEKELAKIKGATDKLAEQRDELAKVIRAENTREILSRWADFSWFALGVGVTASYAVFSSFNESIWGHGDRQASRYWNKIFHDRYQLSNAYAVNDLPKILRSLAKTFGYQVNDRALHLAE